MIPRAIEQAVGSRGHELAARSPGIDDAVADQLARLIDDFGPPPAGPTLFVRPIGDRHTAVARTAAGQCYFLVFVTALYRIIGDPFLIAQRFPPPWGARGELPTLEWPDEPLRRRTVETVQDTLKTDEGPTLLGAAQALADGGRVVFERLSPDQEILQRLWTLLPNSTRGELTVATFCPDPHFAERFNAVVVPPGNAVNMPRYLTEQQAGDYPEGRYELNLQIATEAGDQAALDRLFARRSGRQTIRLGVVLIVGLALLAAAMRLLLR